MNILKDKNFVIVDVETTGSSPIYDRIIEIGILRVENGEVIETFQTLLNPQTPISPFIENITGIKNRELLGAPSFEDVSHKIGELLSEGIFVAHNARFDYGFVKNELKRSGVNFNAKSLCTVKLSRKLFPTFRRHDLSTLIDRFNLQCENRHRAFDDAKVLWDFILSINSSNRGEELNDAISEILKENILPQFLDALEIKKLPENPGVYKFISVGDEILYVGKSKNIKQRVLSHFSNDHASTKEMHLCQQTARIETIETAGELSALILESRLVKELSPIYNRQLRRTSELVLAKKIKKGKYWGIELERSGVIDPKEYKNIVGVFKNISQAKTFLRKVSSEFSICPRLLGLEKGKGACFNYQIEKCSGACIEKDIPEDYKKRFLAAFKNRRLKAWPFGGAIVITEKKDDENSHSFVLDNWCLLHDIEMTSEDLIPKNHIARFDYDTYKIFRRYIKDPINKKNIRPLNKKDLKQINIETENTEKYVYID